MRRLEGGGPAHGSARPLRSRAGAVSTTLSRGRRSLVSRGVATVTVLFPTLQELRAPAKRRGPRSLTIVAPPPRRRAAPLSGDDRRSRGGRVTGSQGRSPRSAREGARSEYSPFAPTSPLPGASTSRRPSVAEGPPRVDDGGRSPEPALAPRHRSGGSTSPSNEPSARAPLLAACLRTVAYIE